LGSNPPQLQSKTINQKSSSTRRLNHPAGWESEELSQEHRTKQGLEVESESGIGKTKDTGNRGKWGKWETGKLGKESKEVA
jgi:hypothetical protein